MENYKFFMIDKFDITVLSFVSHICNQATRIRVKDATVSVLHFPHVAILLFHVSDLPSCVPNLSAALLFSSLSLAVFCHSP
jgi:hypothetical protein